MRTPKEVRDIISSAFIPLRCVTEVHYERDFGFRVHGPDDSEVFTRPLAPIRPIQYDAELERFILGVRALIEQRGFTLDPWQLPT